MTDDLDQQGLGAVTVRAVGPATEGGRLPLSELARIASGLQTTLERIGFGVARGGKRRGRPPKEIADAVRLDFVGFSAGSAVLDLAVIEETTSESLLGTCFTALADGVRRLSQDPAHLPEYFDTAVVNGLVTLCGGISSRNVSRIEFTASNGVGFRLDQEVRATLKEAQKASTQQEITVVGRLHMGDFDPMALRCRIDTHAGSIACDLDDELREPVLDLLDELVSAAGVAEFQPDGTTIRVLHLTGISAVETSVSKSLDELAAEQRVLPVQSVDDLRGEDIADFDTFLEIVRSAR